VMSLRCMARFAQKALRLAPLSRPPWRIALSHAPSLDFLMRASLATHRARPFWCGLRELRAHSRCQGTLRWNALTIAIVKSGGMRSRRRLLLSLRASCHMRLIVAML
jgi:hypothetical protein